MIYIYTLTDPITNLVRYVGKTRNLKERFKAHKNIARDLGTHKRNWVNKLKRSGHKPTIEIIDIIESDWQFWESYWISQFKAWGFDLINHTAGGEGLSIGNATSFRKGNIPWNKGLPVSKDIKDKISLSLQGNKCKPKVPIIQLDIKGNFIREFPSITEAAFNTGSNISHIHAVCNGKRKYHNNFIWKHKTKKDLI